MDLFADTWRLRNAQPRDTVPLGPVRALSMALLDADWHLSDPDTMVVGPEPEDSLALLHADSGLVEHKFREALRLKQLRCLARRRPDYRGVEAGVDRTSTMKPYTGTVGLWRFRYRCMLAGALTTRVREDRKKKCRNATCQCCDLQLPETEGHLLWDCPNAFYGLIRDGLRCPIGFVHDLPPCLRLHGIIPSNLELERPELLASDLQGTLVCLAAARDHMQPEEEPLAGQFARRVRQRRG